MKILVLGANSFSGHWFCDVARAAGHQVAALGRPAWDMNEDASAGLLASLVDVGYKHVVNYAALNIVSASWELAPDYYRTNVAGVARIADALAASKITKFLQVTTPEVYGTTGAPIKENSPFNPSTPYAVSRAAADIHLALMHRERGLPVCFTRTVNVYGERQQEYRVIPKTAIKALFGGRLPLEGGGKSTRSFIHASDAAAATLLVLERGRPGRSYHVAHPEQTSILMLVRTICRRLGRDPDDVIENVPERLGKDMNYQLDDSRIRAELGWRETISLDDGLNRTLAWIKANKKAEIAH